MYCHVRGIGTFFKTSFLDTVPLYIFLKKWSQLFISVNITDCFREFCQKNGDFFKVKKPQIILVNLNTFFQLPRSIYKLEHQLSSTMEKIMNNPGLQHLAENIFWNLHVEDLKICAQINHSCKQILQIPIFCLI